MMVPVEFHQDSAMSLARISAVQNTPRIRNSRIVKEFGVVMFLRNGNTAYEN